MPRSARVPAYRVKVTLRRVKPPTWRRLVLPGQWHLGKVHDAVQVAMGWNDTHLHEFELDGFRYGEPHSDWGIEVRRETAVRLHELLPEPGGRLRYTYDFGDDWEHDILVEELLEPARSAACLGGRRACPPEDCGGPWGYAELLAALRDPSHEAHAEYEQWIGGGFDPDAFDREATDARLKSLR